MKNAINYVELLEKIMKEGDIIPGNRIISVSFIAEIAMKERGIMKIIAVFFIAISSNEGERNNEKI